MLENDIKLSEVGVEVKFGEPRYLGGQYGSDFYLYKIKRF